MRVLVTGGAGYIGSHVVQLLVESGYDVVVYDSLARGHRQAVHPDARLIVGDLRDFRQLRAAFAAQDFDGVMHFASRIQVGESMRQPFLYLRENVYSVINLLEIASRHGISRFILSSTANLFDAPKRMPISRE